VEKIAGADGPGETIILFSDKNTLKRLTSGVNFKAGDLVRGRGK
jgi:hypothetical protein